MHRPIGTCTSTPHATLAQELKAYPIHGNIRSLNPNPRPLCSICSSDYYMSETNGCLECSVGNAWTGPLIVVVIIALLAAVAITMKDKIKMFVETHQVRRLRLEGVCGCLSGSEWVGGARGCW